MELADGQRQDRGETGSDLFVHWDQLVRLRRSIRGFDPSRDVPDSYIQKILECARWAPSSGNSQPWEFVVIRRPELRKRIIEYYVKDRELTVEIEKEARGGNVSKDATFRNAPVYILILGDPRCREASLVRSQKERPDTSFITSLANVTYTIHLTAASLGLACQYVTSVQSAYMDTVLRKLLGIPEPLRCYEMTPIGWPIKRPKAPERRAVEEMTHYDGYDLRKWRTDEDIRRWVYQYSRRANRRMLRASE